MLGRKQEEKTPARVCVRVCSANVNARVFAKKKRQKPENYTSHTGWRRTLARNEGKLIFPASLSFASAWKQANTAHVSSCLTFVRYRDTTRYSGESAKEVLENRDFFHRTIQCVHSVCVAKVWAASKTPENAPTHAHPVEKKKEDDDDESKW